MENRQVYKKVWFWLLIILALIGIFLGIKYSKYKKFVASGQEGTKCNCWPFYSDVVCSPEGICK